MTEVIIDLCMCSLMGAFISHCYGCSVPDGALIGQLAWVVWIVVDLVWLCLDLIEGKGD